jgi:RNA polymerase sigma-70 factor (ECF subfamily)
VKGKVPYDEKYLLGLLARGYEPAFRTLYNNWHHRIYSFAMYLTHSEVLAEEVTQEIFIKIWSRRAELMEIRQFEPWINTIVRNQCYTFLSRLAKERLILEEINREGTQVAIDTNPTEDGLNSKDCGRLLHDIIVQLPEQQRKVFILSRKEGMKNEEIAKEMGLSINTIKSHLKRALKNIRQILGDPAISVIFILGNTILYR